MTKREMNERNIKIKAQDLITLRNKKDLSFDFMENYLTKFKPELLEKFYDLVAYGSNGKEFFAENCPEIMVQKVEKPLTKAQIAQMKLKELREKKEKELKKSEFKMVANQ